MNLLTVLLAILGAAAVFFVVSFAVDLVKHKDELKKENVVVGFFIGLVTDFFDTLGTAEYCGRLVSQRLDAHRNRKR